MHRTLLRALTFLGTAAALAAPATAQIPWDSPALVSPAVPAGFSIFLINPHGGDLGALGTLRHAAGPVGLGYRAAIADQSGPGGDIAFSAGIDVSGMLARAVEGSEVDVMWWTGGGLGVGDEVVVTAPLGVILGWSGGGEVVFSPYGGGHVVLDFVTGPGDAVSFEGVIDLGIDLVLSSGWMVRAGASVGDRESLALGLRLPTGGG